FSSLQEYSIYQQYLKDKKIQVSFYKKRKKFTDKYKEARNTFLRFTVLTLFYIAYILKSLLLFGILSKDYLYLVFYPIHLLFAVWGIAFVGWECLKYSNFQIPILLNFSWLFTWVATHF